MEIHVSFLQFLKPYRYKGFIKIILSIIEAIGLHTIDTEKDSSLTVGFVWAEMYSYARRYLVA